jgi:hypothetical protein
MVNVEYKTRDHLNLLRKYIMASLADIRARIAAQDNKSSNKGSNTQSDNSV